MLPHLHQKQLGAFENDRKCTNEQGSNGYLYQGDVVMDVHEKESAVVSNKQSSQYDGNWLIRE